MTQESEKNKRQNFLRNCWRIILILVLIAIILFGLKLLWKIIVVDRFKLDDPSILWGIILDFLFALIFSTLIFKPKGMFAWMNKSYSIPLILKRSLLLLLLIVFGSVVARNGMEIYQEVLVQKKFDSDSVNATQHIPPPGTVPPKIQSKEYQISVESYLTSLIPPHEKEYIDADLLYSSSTGRVDSRGFVNVWQLRRELAEVEPLITTNDTDVCFTEGNDYQDEESPPDAKELERRRQEAQAHQEQERACVSDVESRYKKYIAASAAFNQVWVPILMGAIYKGDFVAEVIMRQCQTTPILDRTQIESVCDALPVRKGFANKRLLAIGFSPAYDWDDEFSEKSMFVNRKLGYGYKGMFDLQGIALAGMQHGVYGLDSNALTPFANYSDINNSVSDYDTLKTYQNTVLIKLARKYVRRGFTLPGYPTLSLNRRPIINEELTWGAALLEQAKKGSDYLDGATFPTNFRIDYMDTRQLNMSRIFPNLVATNTLAGLDVSIYEKQLGEILNASEASINYYLKQDPRWAVFLINRVGYHEYYPVGINLPKFKFDQKWAGRWKLAKSYKDWRLVPEKSEVSIEIQSDGEYMKATSKTEGAPLPPLQDIQNCTLRYSGGLTYLWSREGVINAGYEGHPIYESSTPLGDLSGYNSLGTKRFIHIDMSVFSPFDPKQRYEQIIMQCQGGEAADTDRVRFLLLANDVLIEFATETPTLRPVFVRQYQRVTSSNSGSYAELATARIAKLKKDAAVAAAKGPQPDKTSRECPVCPEMVVIPAGSFDMGSSHGNESPSHRVTIGKPFAMGKTEVTQGQWKAIMGNNRSFSNCGDSCPVEAVSWGDAKEFIQKLNTKTGKQYRLPSEAEWEYACRAGGQQEYCGSDHIDNVAWYTSNSGNGSNSAATQQANAFGLYDMSGNVWEWVEDSYHGSYNGAPADGNVWQGGARERVLRGGSWSNKPPFLRAANRRESDPAYRSLDIGFRLARTLP